MLRLQTDVKGEGPPLVLVGGGLTGWLSWVPHQERLASTRQVVRVQLLSVQYGLEDQPLPPRYGLKTESDALAGSIAQLGLGGPVDLAEWRRDARRDQNAAMRRARADSRARTIAQDSSKGPGARGADPNPCDPDARLLGRRLERRQLRQEGVQGRELGRVPAGELDHFRVGQRRGKPREDLVEEMRRAGSLDQEHRPVEGAEPGGGIAVVPGRDAHSQ